MTSIADNVAAVRRTIAEACRRVGRDPAGVRLIAVTKSQGPEVLPQLLAAGITDFGENRIDHLAEMHPHATAGRFHFIGRVQGRQLAKLVPLATALHSLCDVDHLDRLARACADRKEPFAVFIQVNASGETAKAGIDPGAVAEFLARVRRYPHLDPIGLMTMAQEGAAIDDLRQTFRRLRTCAERHSLPRLSMGMSQDFPIAIEEGATDIRVGTSLFA